MSGTSSSISTNKELKDSIGGNGTPFYFGTETFAGLSHEFIIVNANAIFDTLLDEDGLDVLIDLGITTNEIKTGMIVKPKNGKTIETIKLTSGSVTGTI